MSETVDPLDVIRPVLNKNNVHALAKLAPKIPNPVCCEIFIFNSTSVVYLNIV